MSTSLDVAIILLLKSILTVCFIYFLYRWHIKTTNKITIIFYWIFGLFFTFLLPFTIVEWILNTLFLAKNPTLKSKDSINSLSALVSLLFYLFIGIKYFKRIKTK